MSDGGWFSARGRHAINILAKIRSEKDSAVGSPASAAEPAGIAYRKWASTVDVYGLELAVSGKTDGARVGRPEGSPGILRARERMALERIQRAHPQQGSTV